MDIEPELFDGFAAKDPRYNARAYCLVGQVIKELVDDLKRQPTPEEIVDDFRDYVLDRYGPMSAMVLEEWGFKECQDIGEVIQNLVEAKLLFDADGMYGGTFPALYDFKDAFVEPFAV